MCIVFYFIIFKWYWLHLVNYFKSAALLSQYSTGKFFQELSVLSMEIYIIVYFYYVCYFFVSMYLILGLRQIYHNLCF